MNKSTQTLLLEMYIISLCKTEKSFPVKTENYFILCVRILILTISDFCHWAWEDKNYFHTFFTHFLN